MTNFFTWLGGKHLKEALEDEAGHCDVEKVNITNINILDLILQDFLGLLDTENYCRYVFTNKRM